MSTGDIAERMGVSRQRARQFTQMPGFPQPAARATRREIPLWDRDDVSRWIATRRPDKAADGGGLVEVWSAPDVARHLGLQVHEVDALPDLPAPTHRHRRSRLWLADEIRAWAAERR